jgi:DNA polymerase III subunit chi
VTRVDFYLLAERSAGDRYLLGCRLTEKAFAQGHQVFLNATDRTEAEKLDRLLWTFRQQSFIPHGLVSTADPALTPVLIGWDNQMPEVKEDVLINLSPEVPAFFSRFDRVLEPIDGQPQVREGARARYRFYRDRGYPLQHHEIKL